MTVKLENGILSEEIGGEYQSRFLDLTYVSDRDIFCIDGAFLKGILTYWGFGVGGGDTRSEGGTPTGSSLRRVVVSVV